MNILFSADGYPYNNNNYSSFIAILCREFIRRGITVTVIAPQSLTKFLLRGHDLTPRYYEDNIDSGCVRVYRPFSLTFGDGAFRKVTLYFNRLVVKHKISMLKERFDVCYSHFWKSAYNIDEWSRKHNIPHFVATGEDVIDIQRGVSNDDIIRMCDSVRGVVCVSTKNMNESIAIGLTRKEKCIVLPNAVDSNFKQLDKKVCRAKLKLPEDAFIVTFCGRFIHRKGVMRVSEAIGKLNDSTINSIFIGSNYENENIAPNCDGILFKGTLPHDIIPTYLNASDVFVLPTLAEGCSNSVVEAMACGLPIISSDLPFNYDILNKENSILVDPMNIDEIASAILTLKTDKVLRDKLSAGALKTAKELTIEKRAAKIINFIKERCSQNE